MAERMPTILWICDRAVEKGGIACALYDLYPALVSANGKIAFAAPKNASFPILESMGSTVHKVLPRYPKVRGYVWSLYSVFATIRLALQLRPQVVVADHTNGLWLILVLKALHLCKTAIYRNHGVGFLTGRPLLAKLVSRGVDLIITVSQPELDALNDLTSRPATLIPNCLPIHCLAPTQFRRLPEDPDSPRIAYVGWLSKEKGIYAFIELMGKIREEIPNAQGIAIGQILLERTSSDSEADLLCRMRLAGISHLGQMAREQIFREVDILVVCSRRESFGLTAMEAPFFDVTPIAYDSPGTRFLLGKTPECLVENENIGKMKEAVVALWRSPEQRLAICNLLRAEFCGEFDPNFVATRLMDSFSI